MVPRGKHANERSAAKRRAFRMAGKPGITYTQARVMREDAIALPPGIAISHDSDSIFYFAGFAGISAALTSVGTATGLLFIGTDFAPYERSILRSARDFVEVWRCTSDFLVKVIKPPSEPGSLHEQARSK